MTPFERVRAFIESEWFARLFALAAVGWTMVTFTGWQRAEARADWLARVNAENGVRWQVIKDRCVTNERGGLACPDGTLTTSTTVAK